MSTAVSTARFEWSLLIGVFTVTIAVTSGLWPNAAVDTRVQQLIAELDTASRDRACTELMGFGPAAKAAVPALIAHSNHGEDFMVLNALIRMGPATTLSALTQALESDDKGNAALAARVIAFYGPAAAAAKPALLKAASDPQLKYAAAEALRAVEGEEDVVEHLRRR